MSGDSETEELCAFNIRTLPIDLRCNFRALCADLKVGMSEGMILLMSNAVDRQLIPGVKSKQESIRMPRFSDPLK